MLYPSQIKIRIFMQQTLSCDCLVAGGGPAGLSAAIAAAEAGRRVIVAEYLPSPGRKLLASGSGKCNLTNALPPEALARRFSAPFRFVRPALYSYPPGAWREFLSARGVPTVSPDGFHYFPKSMRAADVLDALLRRCRTLGVTILPGTPLRKLLIRDGKISGAESGRDRVDSPRLILACGGMGYPQLGGRGSGYELAREAGHRIVPPVPALVGLRAAEGWAARLPGIILPAATVRFEKNPAGTGELIFTHNGVSGPAVLDLSGSVARHLENAAEAVLACNWQSRPPEAYREQFALWQKQDGKKQLKTLLARMLPAAFADALCEAAELPGGSSAAHLRAAQRDRLVAALTSYPLRISGTDGWSKAMATAGGVPPEEVDAKTLSSRFCAGLFFAGEMLDVGAPCGGYNIQWAVSSGRLAGSAAARL